MRLRTWCVWSAFLFCWKSESVTLSLWNGAHNCVRWLWRRLWNLQPLERTYRSVSGCPLSGGHYSGWRLFPKGRGVGWSQIHVSISRMRWEHLSLPSVAVFWVRTGKLNMNSCCVIWWYQIISFCSSVYFYLGSGGEGVCSKDLKMLQTLSSLEMIDRTQTWADGCLASVSVRGVTELSCHISWAAVVVVLALMLNFIVLLRLLVITSWEQSEFCSQRLQQYSCHGRGWAAVVPAGSFLLAVNFWSIFSNYSLSL